MKIQSIQRIIEKKFFINNISQYFIEQSANTQEIRYLPNHFHYLLGENPVVNLDYTEVEDFIYHNLKHRMFQLRFMLNFNIEKETLTFKYNYEYNEQLSPFLAIVTSYLKALQWAFKNEQEYVNYIQGSSIYFEASYHSKKHLRDNLRLYIRISPNLAGYRIDYMNESIKKLISNNRYYFEFDFNNEIVKENIFKDFFSNELFSEYEIDHQNIEDIMKFITLQEMIHL